MKKLKISTKIRRISMVIPLSLSLLISSCETEESTNSTENTEVTADLIDTNTDEEIRLTLEAEQYDYEGLPVVSKYLYGTKVKVTDIGDGQYALGDMILTDENFGSELEKGAFDRYATKWPNNTILYRYNNNAPQAIKNKVDLAANYITRYTNLTVRKWNNNDREGYVWVTYYDRGCSASLGYKNKKFPGQTMNISSSCSPGSTVHEFFHVAGIIHEQNHWNRDNHINVFFENIMENRRSQFFKLPKWRSYTYSSVPDFNSIMMYGSDFFINQNAANNGFVAMGKKNGSLIYANRNYITNTDIKNINAVYY